ncbi:MAG: NHLP leader peptide family RiPP precursor [Xenococcaceae cyanobacterium MO_188.B32]|nr:NHLP leader peptide family RiPP precursor [Xenococcaceae cyanobacterium MO_188.B32]
MSILKEFILEQRAETKHRIILRAWEDEAFKQELLNNPREVLAKELNLPLPQDLQVQVIEEKKGSICLVLPQKLAEELANVEINEEKELSEAELEAVSGGVNASLDITVNNKNIGSYVWGAADLQKQTSITFNWQLNP